MCQQDCPPSEAQATAKTLVARSARWRRGFCSRLQCLAQLGGALASAEGHGTRGSPGLEHRDSGRRCHGKKGDLHEDGNRSLGMRRRHREGRRSVHRGWLVYHRLLGVNHFFLYDNDSKLPLRSLLRAYESFVTVIDWPGDPTASWPGRNLQII